MDILAFPSQKTCFSSEKFRRTCLFDVHVSMWADSGKAELCTDADVLCFDAHKDELVGSLVKVHGLSMRTNKIMRADSF